MSKAQLLLRGLPPQHSITPQFDFLFPAPGNSEEPRTPNDDKLHDPFLPQEDDLELDGPSDWDLAQALELLAKKITMVPTLENSRPSFFNAACTSPSAQAISQMTMRGSHLLSLT